ncbi:hypothetical protein V5N11_032847 [Cardamine amara subsp. amara]|uniref:Uncharacterized protein n=1 Tax=Cardamine amara subsp. amara TaxID=228776 RepID=A0ABD0Z799_CARAN
MASKPSSVTNVSNQNYQSQPSIEDRMAIVVKRVGEVNGMVVKSPLYWESIDFLAKDEISRGIFYALPDGCKLHYLKRKTKASNLKEEEPFYGQSHSYDW